MMRGICGIRFLKQKKGFYGYSTYTGINRKYKRFTFEKQVISYWEKEQFEEKYEPRKIVSILNKLLLPEDYNEVLKKKFNSI